MTSTSRSPLSTLELIPLLVRNQARETTRSASRKQELTAKIILSVLLAMVTLNLLGLGLFVDRYLKILAPGEDPVRAFNSALLYYFAFDFILRFIFQRIPSRSAEPYLLTPLRKSSVVHFFLMTSALNLFNALPILVFLPAALTLVKGQAGGPASWGWLSAIVSIILCSSYSTVFIKKKLLDYPGLNLWAGLSVVALMALDKAGLIPVSSLSATLFALPLEHPWLASVPAFFVGVIYALDYRSLRSRMTIEHLRLFSRTRASSYAGLGFLDRFGDIGTFVSLELKLLLRNKRSRAQMFFALTMVPLMMAMIVFLNIMGNVYPTPGEESLHRELRTPDIAERRVTFRCVSPSIPEGATIFLSGSHPALGSWNPLAIPMILDHDSQWSRTLILPAGTLIEYRYTLGSRRTPMLSPDGESLPPLTFTVGGDTVVSATVDRWRIPATEAIVDFNLMYFALVLTFMLSLSYGQFILGWESNYLDLLISRPLNFLSYFEAKFFLLLFGGIASYVASLVLVFLRPQFFGIITATSLYSLGVNSYMLLFLSTYNRKRMDLTASIFGMQGKGGIQFFTIVPTLIGPIVLFLIFRTAMSRDVALLVMGGTGVAGLLLHRIILRVIIRQFQKKRYLIAAAFRQSP